MDRVLKKKLWNAKRIASLAGIGVIIALITASWYYTSGNSRVNVDIEKITVSQITKNAFQETIPVNGVVMPITTIYLDAMVGGRVEEKYVEDGAAMKKGDPIMRLSNTDLELSLVNQETSVFNLLTQMQISRNSARQNTIAKLNQMEDAESAFKEAERIYTVNKTLYEQKAVSLQEFKKAQLDYNYQVKRMKLTQQILKQDSVSTAEQLSQASHGYKRTQASLELMRKKVGDLIVRAPVDGQLTSMDAEIGQNRSAGQRLGQIDVLSGFKVRVEVDEHYISRIFTGLQGDFSLGDKTYQLRIKKVFTQVTNGRFQVDMEFVGALPKDIRRGQSLQIRVALSDETQAILLPRGGFYQQTGGNWIFKLSEDGKTAYRVDLQLGRQDPDYYEVLQGLKPGDKVVTSSYETYEKMQELVLKKQ